MPKQNKIRFSIRKKLFVLSIAILCIPYVGLEYLRELERYLRDTLEVSLTEAARSMAGPLHGRDTLFPTRLQARENTLYIHKLGHQVQLDGYTDDWGAYLDWSDVYIKGTDADPGDRSFSYRLVVSHYEQYFYVLLEVNDRDIVYQKADTPGTIDNDHVELVFTDPAGKLKQFYFSPTAPGSIRPFTYATNVNEFDVEYKVTEYSTNIIGEWQPGDGGYNLEIAIPKNLIGAHMGFVVTDVSAMNSRQNNISIGTAGTNTDTVPGRLLLASAQIEQIIQDQGRMQGRRIWVLDSFGQVLANGGSLDNNLLQEPVNLLYAYILPSVNERFSDDLAGASRLQGQEVKQAIQGESGTHWRSSPDGKAIIVSAAAPVWIDGEIRGVVVIEETTNNIQMLQRRAMASLFNKTLLVYVMVTVLLLIYATRLSLRIRRLSREAESAIDQHGRVAGSFTPSQASDEIGELSRNYAAMLDRLKQYNEYLESMAGRLSHELRTPIAVVQSSLEHLQLKSDNPETYLERTREGVERLNMLVTRLSEASRLEQALQSSVKQETDIGDLLDKCVEAYRLAYPETGFMLHKPEQPIQRIVAPELIVQMLDKLVANAIDFGDVDKPVELTLSSSGKSWQLSLLNYGSTLPETMAEQLFNSMISIRSSSQGNEPHLGLGLYIVRLITEFHQGEVHAGNLANQKGVEFVMKFSR